MIAIVFVIPIIILFYVLFTPIAFEAGNELGGEQITIIRFKIFPFGFIRLGGREKAEKKKGDDKPAKKTGKKSKNGGLFSYLFTDFEMIKQIATELIRFCFRILGCPYEHHFRLSLTGGLKEPHLTGQLFGAICAVNPILPKSIRLEFEPDFADEILRANYQIGLKFYLAAVFYELFRLLFRLPLIKIAKMIWSRRKGNHYAYQN